MDVAVAEFTSLLSFIDWLSWQVLARTVFVALDRSMLEEVSVHTPYVELDSRRLTASSFGCRCS